MTQQKVEDKVEEKKIAEQDQRKNEDDQEDNLGGATRGEKKFRKAMSKIGMKTIQGINRVTIKKGKAFLINIDNPQIMKSPEGQSYIIYGKPNIKESGANIGENVINDIKNNPKEAEEKVQITKQEQPEQLSEQNLNPDHISEVMQYTKCSRREAVKALIQNQSDTVQAIFQLSN